MKATEARDARRPVWSQWITTPIAAAVPVRSRPGAVRWIKGVHTAIFFSMAGLILLFAWDGLQGRPRRRAAVAAGLALGETAVFASNNLVCPLTPLAEELGASRGSVTDIYLPGWLSRRIPLISGALLVVGLVLNARAAIRSAGLVEDTHMCGDRFREGDP